MVIALVEVRQQLRPLLRLVSFPNPQETETAAQRQVIPVIMAEDVGYSELSWHNACDR